MLVPKELDAVTVKVYVVPFTRPVTVIGDDPPVAVKPPTFEETVYVVIERPPVFPGGVNVMVASPLPRVAVPIVGASGTLTGVTELLALDAVLVPIIFVAVTENV